MEQLKKKIKRSKTEQTNKSTIPQGAQIFSSSHNGDKMKKKKKKTMKLLSLVTFNLKIDLRFSFLLGKTFLTLEKLVTALEYGEVDGILVDLYTASYRSDLFNVTWIVISQIIPFEFTSGAVISRNAGKLEKHFRDYIKTKGTVAVTEVLKKRTNEEKKENKVSVTFLFKNQSKFFCGVSSPYYVIGPLREPGPMYQQSHAKTKSTLRLGHTRFLTFKAV